MRAAVRKNYGNPDVIQILEVEKPTPKDDEILIEVHYSSVNRTDDGFLRAKPFITRLFSGLIKPRKIILGCEFAGRVIEKGKNVSEFKVYDRVFGFDDAVWGGHGEFMTIKASKSVVKIPNNIDYKTASVSTEGAHYALCYVRVLKKLGAKKVLVHGSTGAIGSSAVQLLKHEGFEVIATSPTKQLRLVKSLGADKVIDWQKYDFTESGEIVDAVFDAVGKSRFKDCKKLLKPKGVYIATELGPFVQNPLLGLLSPIYKIFGSKRVLFPIPINNKELISYLADRLKNDEFKPLIDKVFKIDEIAKAYELVESGKKIGNVSIEIKQR